MYYCACVCGGGGGGGGVLMYSMDRIGQQVTSTKNALYYHCIFTLYYVTPINKYIKHTQTCVNTFSCHAKKTKMYSQTRLTPILQDKWCKQFSTLSIHWRDSDPYILWPLRQYRNSTLQILVRLRCDQRLLPLKVKSHQQHEWTVHWKEAAFTQHEWTVHWKEVAFTQHERTVHWKEVAFTQHEWTVHWKEVAFTRVKSSLEGSSLQTTWVNSSLEGSSLQTTWVNNSLEGSSLHITWVNSSLEGASLHTTCVNSSLEGSSLHMSEQFTERS